MIVVAAEPFDGDDGQALTAAYHAFARTRFPGDFDPTRGLPALHRDLVPPRGVFLVARDDGTAIGCGGLKTIETGLGEVKHMFVQPAHRGQGVGFKILTALEDHARERGMSRVVLDTSEFLPEAIALYGRSGYSAVEPYNDNHYATHWFEKHLTRMRGGGQSSSM